MYNISVFPGRHGDGLFKESDILSFNKDFLEAFKCVIDDYVGLGVLDFYKTFESSSIQTDDNKLAEALRSKVKLMHEVLDPKIKTVTSHIEVKNDDELRKIFVIKQSDIKDMPESERTSLKNSIKKLIDNKDYLVDSIIPRSKDDFRKFRKYCNILEETSRVLRLKISQVAPELKLEYTNNIDGWVTVRDGFFFSKDEKVRSTKVQSYILKEPLMLEILRGIECQEYIEKTSTANIRNMRHIDLY